MVAEDRLDGAHDLVSDLIGEAHGIACGVEALDGDPGGVLREEIVHLGGFFEMAEAGFLQIVLGGSVAAFRFLADKGLSLERREAQVKNQRFAGQTVNAIFEMLDPRLKRGALRGGRSGDLMSEIGADVAVGKHDLAAMERGFDAGLGFEAVPGVEKRGEMRINAFERAELAIEKTADHFAEPGVILRESGGVGGITARGQGLGKQIDLRAFSAAVDALDGDDFSAR